MKVFILAGGLGTRLSEFTGLIPKPMVKIGGKPIIWHIMQTFAGYDHKDFYIALGYKSDVIKEYFLNYHAMNYDFTIELKSGSIITHQKDLIDWKATLVDTGETTLTGGRLRRVREYVGEETFCFTYGDGVADVDIAALLVFHHSEGRQATLTAVQPPGRFGSLAFERGRVMGFQEKPQGDGSWINGGFFVLEPSVIDLVDGDQCIWEQRPLQTLAESGQLSAFHHRGFWQPMDTLRDKMMLEELWQKGQAPWKLWG